MQFMSAPQLIAGPVFHWNRRIPSILLTTAMALLIPSVSRAVPSFARQMNLQCIVCHTSYPVLTEFGRQFKLGGYTLSTGASHLPPISVMLQPSFTQTQADQPGGAAPGFGENHNRALTQASIFYAGRLLGPFGDALVGKDAGVFVNKIGIFSQTTYDGIRKKWSWDNTELRFADTTTLAAQSAVFGVYVNNNPTLQDPWNTTPAWGYPFTSSHLAPSPSARALIDGGLAQQVIGAGTYVMFANTFYFDVGGYRTLSASFQKSVGINPAGETQTAKLAPYWRVAVTKPFAGGTWEFGTFGLAADTYPGRDPSAGRDQIVDVGFDSQFQKAIGVQDVTALVSWIHERQTWHASQALGAASNAGDTLRTFKATVDYLYDKTYGATVQYFTINGSRDELLYAGSRTGSPTSDGFILQASYLPFNKGGGPAFWSKSNVKFSIQYVAYTHFDGSRRNIDGAGRNARGNNTLYLEAWILF
jgi:hypothetical protein